MSLTSDDLNKIQKLLKEQRLEIKGDIASVESGLRGEMTSLQTEIKGDMSSLESGLRGEMTSLEGSMISIEKGLRSDMNSLRNDMTSLEAGLRGDMASLEARLTQKIDESGKQIRIEIGDFISDHVIPLFDDLATKSDIDRVERKIDNAVDKNIEQDHRLDKIEATTTVAHELKFKK